MSSSSSSTTGQTAAARSMTIDMDAVDDTFNIYLCHVCKDIESFETSKVCSGCKLISYCSSEHQRLHWRRHKPLCKAAQLLCSRWGVDNVFSVPKNIQSSFSRPKGETPRHEFVHRMALARFFLEQILGRELLPYEKDARNFPKVCEVCFSPCVVKELVCKKCFGVGYCSVRHQELDDHALVCSKYREDFLFHRQRFDDLPADVIKAGPAINLNLDMKTFIATYIHPKLSFEKEAMTSMMYTCVLSLAYAIKRLPDFKLKKNFCVHFVGANELECAFKKYFETFHHIFPKLQVLRFNLIGPDVRDGPPSDQMEWFPLCDHCKSSKKSLTCHYYKGFYDDYCQSPHFFKPDFICCFNSGLHEILPPHLGGDTWKNTLPMFFQFDDVPVVLTAWCKTEAEKDLKRLLANAGGKKVKVFIECERNPFQCLKPFRSWENTYDAVFYKNSYMSILTVPRK